MLMELLYQSASSRPDDEALVYRDERVTHAELVDRVERLAAGLTAEGIGAGDAVALLLPNDPTFVASYYAISALGAVVVPVNPAFKQDELDFYFRQTGVRAVISDDRSAGVCERIVASWDEPAKVIPTSAAHGQALTLDMLMQAEPAKLTKRSPEEPLVNMFSSGSTGRPKRVARTHGQLRGEAEYYDWMGIGPEDKIFCTIPLFHTYGMGCAMLAATRTGATLVLLEDPNPFLLRRQRAMELIRDRGRDDLPGRAVQLPADGGGARLGRPVVDPAGLLRRHRAAAPVLRRLPRQVRRAGPPALRLHRGGHADGQPRRRPGRDLRVGREAGRGRSGADRGRGGRAGRARHGRRDRGQEPRPDQRLRRRGGAQPQAFRDGFFLSGDLGRLDAEGRLTITGRKKLLIEVGGYKVDPIEVEDVVVTHPKVAEAVVVGVGTKVQGEEQIKAVVVPSDEMDERDLIGFCQQRLANFKVPQVVEFREEIPKSPLGKILRKYLI